MSDNSNETPEPYWPATHSEPLPADKEQEDYARERLENEK